MSTWYARVPLEFHGHRKKLDFMLDAVEDLRRTLGRDSSAVRVLEVGCSNGRILSLPLAECGFEVVGADMHEPSIARAASDNTFPNARFICRDAEHLVGEETFDVVILSDILEHVADPAALLRIARGVLRPGGQVLICIPNGYGPAELERRLAERTRLDRLLNGMRHWAKRLSGRESVAYNDDSGHVQAFTLRHIEALVSDAGFAIDQRRQGSLLGGPLTYPIGLLLPSVAALSLRLADILPFWCVSTWYFRCSDAR